MSRPVLEVADIFRDHGAAWRRANVGHVSLDQMKVMSAIERCRTAALGGHVARCEDCPHTVIAYNSCRNRHCPKCQGTAAKEWLAAREADLLPVPYFHVVFTLPAAISDIAYQNKAVIYDILFTTSAETMTTIAADPEHLGARIGITSVLHTWGSALTHHPHVHMIVPGGGISIDGTRWVPRRPDFILPVKVLSRLFRGLFLAKLVGAHRAGRLKFFGVHARLDNIRAFKAYLAPRRKIDWVVYAKRPFGGPRAVLAYLSRYTHRVAISNRRLIRPHRRHLPVEELSDRGAWPLSDHDAVDPRVHPTLPDARAARGLPPHPALRTAGQRPPRRQHRAGARAARRAGPLRTARCLTGPSGRRTPHAATTVPLLRRTHVHQRELRARQRAKAPTHARAGCYQDRHRMMLSSPIQHRTEARHSGRLSPGNTPACADQQDWPVIAPQILSSNVRSARSRQHARSRFELKRCDRQRRLNFPNTHADAKSP